ncbi:hypothetical protein ACOXXX_08695 [Thalassococcus sp. BH17M4-6]|uniref:hypothetical protein n=1 Tax=Thalassococcus sp. BH17M4-6 TaxID=3413148 RepID=UPI003BD2B5FF
MTQISTEERIAQTAQEGAALVRLALGVYGEREGQASIETRLTVPWLGGEAVLRLQDVGGLVDLNTAGVELMEALAAAMDIPPEALQRYRDWRRTPHRLQSVRDFGRVAGLDWHVSQALTGIATVHSGRFGVAPDVAPDRLLDLLGGEIREEWRSAPSGAIYEVRIDSAGQSRLLGIVALGSGSSQGRVLELR